MRFESNYCHHQVAQAALSKAAITGRKVLVEYGGDWCNWSRRMQSVLSTPDIRSYISKNFIFLRCYVGPDGIVDYSSIELPPIDGVPYFSIVGPDGSIVANQTTEDFEFLWFFYRKSAIIKFLEEWARL